MRPAILISACVIALVPTAVAAEDCASLAQLISQRIAATRGSEDTDDPQIREALGKIARLRAPQGARANAAAAALCSPDAGIRHAAVLTLSDIGGEVARRKVTEMLRDREPFVIAAALEGLARFGRDAVLPHARQFARDERDVVRTAAARVLIAEGALSDAPGDSTEVEALRLLDLARRGDATKVRAALHPVRRIEVVEENAVRGFLRTSATPRVIMSEVIPPLRRAQRIVDSLRCGPPDEMGTAVCAVTDRSGYSTELHFAKLLGRLYLFKLRHHGGVPSI